MEFAFGGGQLSLEGRLSQVADADAAIPGVRKDETEVLRRHTLEPRQDFVILPLEWEMLESIHATVLRHLNLRAGNDVIHTQIS